MTLFDYIDAHPWLSFGALLLIIGTVENIITNCMRIYVADKVLKVQKNNDKNGDISG